jgi:exonuclease III
MESNFNEKSIHKLLPYKNYFESNIQKYKTTEQLSIDPYLYSKEVQNFIELLYTESIIMKDFNWGDWHEEARSYIDNLDLIKEAEINTIRKLLTYCVRQDRYCSGVIASFIDKQVFTAVLNRLDHIALTKKNDVDTMNLLTWNAAMKFREKVKYVCPYESDILVIPECESPEKWVYNKFIKSINQFLWFGDNTNKGIGILTLNSKYKIELHPDYTDEFKYVIPIKVTGEKEEFILFAVWAQNTQKRYYSYIGQIYLALNHYEALLDNPCIIIGDWNSNKVFDRQKRVGTHSDVVNYLLERNIYSLYHYYYNEKRGEETQATHYFRKERERPFHIDYIFSSKCFLDRLNKIELGKYDDWIQYSDHLPITANFFQA